MDDIYKLIMDKVEGILNDSDLPKDIAFKDKAVLTLDSNIGFYSLNFVGTLLMRIRNKTCELRPNYLNILNELGYKVKILSTGWLRINLDIKNLVDDLKPLFIKIFKYELDNVHGEEFSCCSHYMQCSDAKVCVQSIFLLSLGCRYRINMINERIVYGVNATPVSSWVYKKGH